MAHFVVTQAPGTWINGYVVPRADWESLDAKVVAAIDGDNGGAWAPSAVISIGGLGLVINGPTIVTGAGTATPGQLSTSGTSRFTLGDATDYQDLAVGHIGRTRTIVTGLAAATATAPIIFALPGAWLASFSYPTVPTFRNRTYMAAQAIATTYLGPATIVPNLLCPLRVHNGATLSSVTITFRVSTPHSNVPTAMPKMRIVRLKADGTATILTTSTDGTGYVSVPTPSSGAAWYAAGAAQSLTITCTQNNVIDLTQYTYLVDIFEEQGATTWPLAATMLQGCKTVQLNPGSALSGLGAIDGYTPSAGDRILVVQGLNTDGIWLAAAGAWSRSTDVPAASSLLGGTFVMIQRGLQFSGTLFQITGVGPYTVGSVALPFLLGGAPSGNLWIAASALHTNITSTQFQ
jgi:hypothetical protein